MKSRQETMASPFSQPQNSARVVQNEPETTWKYHTGKCGYEVRQVADQAGMTYLMNLCRDDERRRCELCNDAGRLTADLFWQPCDRRIVIGTRSTTITQYVIYTVEATTLPTMHTQTYLTAFIQLAANRSIKAIIIH